MSKKGARKSSKGVVRKKGKKNRKWGKQAKGCAMYRALGRREANKVSKLRRHLKRLPGDLQGQAALQSLLSRG